MSFIENLRTKMNIDRLVDKIASTMRVTPGQRNLNKDAMRELLAMTDFEHKKVRDLHIYSRPFNNKSEVLVLDNELPIYHSSVEDIAMRKTPHWKEMFSIGNIKKILNDQEVILSRGKESLQRVRNAAVSRLDLSYNRNDLNELVEGAADALDTKNVEKLRDSLDMFFQIVEFEALNLGIFEAEVESFARPKIDPVAEEDVLYEDLILLDQNKVRVLLMKGGIAPESELHLARALQVLSGERKADAEGADVFKYLADLAMKDPLAKTHAAKIPVHA